MVEIVLLAILGVPAVLVVRALTKRKVDCEDESDVPGFWAGMTEESSDDGWWNATISWDEFDHPGVLGRIGLDPGAPSEPEITKHSVNPATGLPMIFGDESGVDVMGNPYGFDLQQDSFGSTGGIQSDGIDSYGSGYLSGGSGGSLGGDDWS